MHEFLDARKIVREKLIIDKGNVPHFFYNVFADEMWPIGHNSHTFAPRSQSRLKVTFVLTLPVYAHCLLKFHSLTRPLNF
jgi:hypothetical protein